MSQVIAKLRKRRFYPVLIDGETIHLRALLDSEHKEVEPISQDVESFGYAIGCCLMNEDGTAVFSRNPDEDAKTFGARVLTELDLPDDTRSDISKAILKLQSGPPDLDSAIKN